MFNDSLTHLEKELFEIAKTRDFSKVKGFIIETFCYDNVSDKVVYRKLLKLALKVLPLEYQEYYFADYLLSKIDNYWRSPDELNYRVLADELMKKMEELNG
jgi:hypothetical protein